MSDSLYFDLILLLVHNFYVIIDTACFFIVFFFFFFNDTATTEIYTLSLHDALPIYGLCRAQSAADRRSNARTQIAGREPRDRKSTRLNSSHSQISYAVFCLKKKKKDSACRDNS